MLCFTNLQSNIWYPSDVKSNDEPTRLLEHHDRKSRRTVCVPSGPFLISVDMVAQTPHDLHRCYDCNNDENFLPPSGKETKQEGVNGRYI